MKAEKIKRWIEKNMQDRLEEFGLEEWDSVVRYNSNINPGVVAKTFITRESKFFELVFYAVNISCEQYLSDTLDHELGHVILAGADLIEKVLTIQFPPKAIKKVTKVFRQRDEVLVIDFLHSLNAIRKYNQENSR